MLVTESTSWLTQYRPVPMGELTNYHHRSLGSPTIWSVLNAFKNNPAELISMPGKSKDLITEYIELSTATVHLGSTNNLTSENVSLLKILRFKENYYSTA